MPRTPIAEGWIARRTSRGTSTSALHFQVYEDEAGRAFIVSPHIRDGQAFIRLTQQQADSLRSWVGDIPPRPTRRASNR